MEEFQIKSKIYYPTEKKEKTFYTVVKVAAIFLLIYGIASIFMKGFDLDNITTCILAGTVLTRVLQRSKRDGYFEFKMLSLVFSKDMLEVVYLPKKENKIEIDLNSVSSLKYSKEQECLKLVCDYKDHSDKKVIAKQNKELPLYIKYEDNPEFFKTIEEKTGKKVQFID